MADINAAEFKLWTVFLKALAAVLVVLILSVSSCGAHKDYLRNSAAVSRNSAIVSMVENGAMPIAARCAIQGMFNAGAAAVCSQEIAAGRREGEEE